MLKTGDPAGLLLPGVASGTPANPIRIPVPHIWHYVAFSKKCSNISKTKLQNATQTKLSILGHSDPTNVKPNKKNAN